MEPLSKWQAESVRASSSMRAPSLSGSAAGWGQWCVWLEEPAAGSERWCSQPVEEPKTIATAIKIGKPASWDGAMEAIRDSGGLVEAVTDAEILEAYRLVAATEGVFCEPASAASIAGVWKKAKARFFPEGARVVCTLTGHGLKDPETAISGPASATRTGASFDEVARAVETFLA